MWHSILTSYASKYILEVLCKFLNVLFNKIHGNQIKLQFSFMSSGSDEFLFNRVGLF
jgi:hypothetical protein